MTTSIQRWLKKIQTSEAEIFHFFYKDLGMWGRCFVKRKWHILRLNWVKNNWIKCNSRKVMLQKQQVGCTENEFFECNQISCKTWLSSIKHNLQGFDDKRQLRAVRVGSAQTSQDCLLPGAWQPGGQRAFFPLQGEGREGRLLTSWANTSWGPGLLKEDNTAGTLQQNKSVRERKS